MGWNRWLKERRSDNDSPSPRPVTWPDAPDSESLVFTEGQRRHLETAFRSLLAGAQEARARLQNLATIAGEPPGWAQEVAAEIDRLILQARRAATTLDLQLDRNEIPLQRELAAWASTSWSIILGCRPSALRGYGSVDARLAQSLGPMVEEMAARLLHIQRLAEAASDPDPHGG